MCNIYIYIYIRTKEKEVKFLVVSDYIFQPHTAKPYLAVLSELVLVVYDWT